MEILNATFKSTRNDYHISLCTPSMDWTDLYNYYPVVSTDKQANRDTARGKAASRTYSSALNLISTYNPTVHYDPIYECAWFNYYETGGEWHQV
ncbi:MAG: hypothetical protein ACOC44_04785 [Promethearchaeia archaeon]